MRPPLKYGSGTAPRAFSSVFMALLVDVIVALEAVELPLARRKDTTWTICSTYWRETFAVGRRDGSAHRDELQAFGERLSEAVASELSGTALPAGAALKQKNQIREGHAGSCSCQRSPCAHSCPWSCLAPRCAWPLRSGPWLGLQIAGAASQYGSYRRPR